MSDERTEAATPKRRQKAREEGRVARSSELVSCLLLLGVLWSAPLLLSGLGAEARSYWQQSLRHASQPRLRAGALPALARECIERAGALAAPTLAIAVAAAVVGNLCQVGFVFQTRPLQPKLSRVDPLAGLRRLFAVRSAVELTKGFVKVALVGTAAWSYLNQHQDEILRLSLMEPGAIPAHVGRLAHGMALQMVGTLALLAALDYAYERWQFERSLRMTKAEVKEEFKEAEGSPEIKQRIRSLQREVARRRMMAQVPLASVVITNPTHYAVALRYEAGKPGAPKVVAKGQDLLAQRIREIAAEHRVPCVPNPPLARTLYRLVALDQEIPPTLYRAVAEVLALVWRAADRQRQ